MVLGDITDGRIPGSYFNDKGFFKADITSGTQVTIPEIERNILNIDVGDELNIAAVFNDKRSSAIRATGVEVISRGRITIPREDYKRAKEIVDFSRFRRSLGGDGDIAQLIIESPDSYDIVKKRLVPNKYFFFNTAVFKAEIFSIEDNADTLGFGIPKIESEVLNLTDEDEINAVIIDGSNVPFRKRNVLRLNLVDVGEGILRATIPSRRVRLDDIFEGATVQIVAERADS